MRGRGAGRKSPAPLFCAYSHCGTRCVGWDHVSSALACPCSLMGACDAPCTALGGGGGKEGGAEGVRASTGAVVVPWLVGGL